MSGASKRSAEIHIKDGRLFYDSAEIHCTTRRTGDRYLLNTLDRRDVWTVGFYFS